MGKLQKKRDKMVKRQLQKERRDKNKQAYRDLIGRNYRLPDPGFTPPKPIVENEEDDVEFIIDLFTQQRLQKIEILHRSWR